MHTLLKRSELVWMEGVGHMPNLEREVEFNEAMERLLEGIISAADLGRSEGTPFRKASTLG
jgi:hypothetical protein